MINLELSFSVKASFLHHSLTDVLVKGKTPTPVRTMHSVHAAKPAQELLNKHTNEPKALTNPIKKTGMAHQ